MRVGLCQLTASDEPSENLDRTVAQLREGAAQGAQFLLTPEVTNCVSSDRDHQTRVLKSEGADPTLAALRALALELDVWVLIGSLALKTGDADGRFANRSFLIGPDGGIRARYDKIHMFDVAISDAESYRESAGYRPGSRAVLAPTPFGNVGMTVCYDLRFPELYRGLAQAGAQILTVPAAFSPVTGAAHWEVLLRARAIENGAFVLAPAQTGHHSASAGRARRTHGHSMVVAPWGEVLLDAGTEPGVHLVDLDMTAVSEARQRVPSLTHDREYGAADE